ncbi:UxaA family hydrolase [Helicobacter anatolicus]|uniref:UxaA family hydrolase n=1 Tax=Helicobacter anatolicus TaxID=2905874 RepID=UPI001E374B7D|nr:UxaA family hydrolase [Helicobacter anatolicus]MCE3036453.1 UxaA family hydrolase [Helicobacter anatolicus]MCE3039770.1 UxaA family hydrolase [Helicobacter anatolicus]
MQFIIINQLDNVATTLKDCKSGEKLGDVTLLQDIKNGHKFAIKDILKGENIMKYGEVIAQASCDIKKGSHVHIHNIEGIRGRGDKQ